MNPAFLLCEETRRHAFELMLQHAADLGGNAAPACVNKQPS